MLVPDEIRKCVAFATCNTKDGMRLAGTVFFVSIPFPSGFDGHFIFAVTARHVIEAIRANSVDGMVGLRLNFRNGSAEIAATELKDWYFHPTDNSIDVAVMAIALPEGLDLVTWPIKGFATDDVIAKEKISLGEEVFIVGLFTKHYGNKRNIPIVRVGNIAAMPEEPIQSNSGPIEAYLIESRSIGGLSGSPVFVHLGLVRVTEKGQLEHSKKGPYGVFYLLGIIHGHWEMEATDSDAQILDAQQEKVNMGIAIVVPAKQILETIRQPEFLQRMERVLAGIKKRNELAAP